MYGFPTARCRYYSYPVNGARECMHKRVKTVVENSLASCAREGSDVMREPFYLCILLRVEPPSARGTRPNLGR